MLRKVVGGLADFIRANPLDPLPIRSRFSGHTWADTRTDFQAGLNVALLAFPQGMAYAVIAELPIKYGIVSGAIAALVAPLFAGSRHTILGPTNATAFMIFSSFAAFGAAQREALLPLLVLLVGILLVLGALFRVADLIQYISRSVVVGYITGAAILIIANQMRHILGVGVDPVDADAGPRTFFTIVQGLAGHVKETQWQPVVLGVTTVVVWLVLSRIFKKLPVFAITLVVMSLIYGLLHKFAGWQVDAFAPFSVTDLKPTMPTISERGLFYDLSHLLGIAFSVAFLASLENSVMSKTLASRSGDRPDMNQDMLSVGMANLAKCGDWRDARVRIVNAVGAEFFKRCGESAFQHFCGSLLRDWCADVGQIYGGGSENGSGFSSHLYRGFGCQSEADPDFTVLDPCGCGCVDHDLSVDADHAAECCDFPRGGCFDHAVFACRFEAVSDGV